MHIHKVGEDTSNNMSLESVQFLAGLFQLHDRYGELPTRDATMEPKWEQLRDDVASGRPSAQDIQTVRHMLRAVLRGHEDTTNMDPLVWGVVRWMGAVDHAVERRVPVRQHDASNNISLIFSQWGIDPLRLSLLLLVSSWTPDITPVQDGLERYLQLSPDLRSHFTSAQNVLDEIVGTILSLKPQNITPDFRASLREIFSPEVKRYLNQMYVDLRTLLFEHGDHWVLLYNDIQDRLWESEAPVHVYWADINMTSINERDPDGRYGNDFLAVVGAWLRSRRNLQGVVRNIQRTSFQFIADSAAAVANTMRDFSADVSHGLTSNPVADPTIVDDFVPEAVVSERIISRENIYDYAIQSLEDLDAFASVIGFNDMFGGDDLTKGGLERAKERLHGIPPDFRGIRQSGSLALIDTLNALIIKAIYEMNGRLAAQNKFFEKTDLSSVPVDFSTTMNPSTSMDPSEQGGRAHPFQIFRERDLPRPAQKELYDQWKGFEVRKAGFVNPGQYFPSRNPELHDKPDAAPTFNKGIDKIPLLHIGDNGSTFFHLRVAEFLRLAPRLGRLKGEISHRREGSPGGANDRFLDRLWELAHLPDNSENLDIETVLWAWQQEAKKLSEVYHQVYAVAVTDLRHAWTPKQHETFAVPRYRGEEEMHADFVAQEMALQGCDAVAALEYDSWSAYQAKFPSTQVDDKAFNRVRDAFFVKAHALGLPPPIIRPAGGDHVSVAFVDPSLQLPARSQAHVTKLFGDEPFHDFNKVEMQEISFRTRSLPARLVLASLAEGLRQTLQLNAEVKIKLSASRDILSVTLPTHNQDKAEVTSDRVASWFRSHSVVVEHAPVVVKNIARLPMWLLKGEDTQIAKNWYFGTNPPRGYEPYKKTATISLAIDTFPPITNVAGLLDFKAAEKRANVALADVKVSAWPAKAGLVRVAAPHLPTTTTQRELESHGFRGLVDPALMKWIDHHPDVKHRLLVLLSEHSNRSQVVKFLQEARNTAGLPARAENLSPGMQEISDVESETVMDAATLTTLLE